jgi:hypothetical protein
MTSGVFIKNDAFRVWQLTFTQSRTSLAQKVLIYSFFLSGCLNPLNPKSCFCGFEVSSIV